MESAHPLSSWRCAAGALEPGQAATFELARGGGAVPGFIVNHGGRHFAYVNRCPHAGAALDSRSLRFFSDDAIHLVCSVHGAVFQPDTGVCVEGPCPGARLETLAVPCHSDVVVVTSPA